MRGPARPHAGSDGEVPVLTQIFLQNVHKPLRIFSGIFDNGAGLFLQRSMPAPPGQETGRTIYPYHGKPPCPGCKGGGPRSGVPEYPPKAPPGIRARYGPGLTYFSKPAARFPGNAATRFSNMVNSGPVCRSTAGNAPGNSQE